MIQNVGYIKFISDVSYHSRSVQIPQRAGWVKQTRYNLAVGCRRERQYLTDTPAGPRKRGDKERLAQRQRVIPMRSRIAPRCSRYLLSPRTGTATASLVGARSRSMLERAPPETNRPLWFMLTRRRQ